MGTIYQKRKYPLGSQKSPRQPTDFPTSMFRPVTGDAYWNSYRTITDLANTISINTHISLFANKKGPVGFASNIGTLITPNPNRWWIWGEQVLPTNICLYICYIHKIQSNKNLIFSFYVSLTSLK